jgi:exodeoxyribonuclease V gamma subunit
MREVEVLHDQLLAIFEEDPGLRPADIVVMTPDIDAYAPYISSVFGAAQDEATCIPFAIADRGSRGEAAAAAGFLGLLDLGGSRMGAAEVLGLLECAAIRARFEFEDGDLPVIKSWVKQSGIRWGEDENARLALNLPGYAHNSWKAGIERMLLGYAMPSRDRDLIQGVLAFDTVEGGETRTLANFLSFCDSVFALAHDLQSPRTLAGWRRRLQALLADFFAPSDEAQRETKAIQRVLEELAALQPAAGFDAPVALGVVRAFAAARFERERVGHGFLSGGVTFCAMLPMRTIPFEVVCLIGMNHDAFPRGRPPLAFDLMARHPRRGDRSRRSDDKYLFLEALLAARRRLYISFTGQSIQDNSRLPPSTTVGELIDVLAKGYLAPAGEGCDRPGLVTEHRLQAFSEAYFLEDSALFSYSPEDLTACAAGRERHQPGPFFPRPLPLAAEDVAPYREISPERLSAFLAHPAAFLVRNRIGIHLEEGPEALDDREPFALDPLARYRIGKDLLQKILAGGEPRELLDVYRAAGELPHGRAGGFLFSRMASEVARFAAAVERVLPMAGTEAFELDLPFEELHLKGRLTVPAGLGCLLLRYARLRAKDYLGLWVRHLCLGLAGSGAASRASLLIGRDAAFTFRPVAAGRRILADLLALFRRGLAAPLHFFPESSLAYFKSLQKQPADDAAALFRARQRWVQSDFSAGESEDPYYRLCFEHSDPLDADFRSLAAAVFEPLFNHCEPLAPVIDNGHRSPDTDRS